MDVYRKVELVYFSILAPYKQEFKAESCVNCFCSRTAAVTGNACLYRAVYRLGGDLVAVVLWAFLRSVARSNAQCLELRPNGTNDRFEKLLLPWALLPLRVGVAACRF